MTAHALKGDRERCLKAGMDGYTAKPIDADELFAAIESRVCRPVEEGHPVLRVAASDTSPPPADRAFTPLEADSTVSGSPGHRLVPGHPVLRLAGESMIDWSAALKGLRGDQRLLETIVKTASGEIPRLLAEIRRAAAAGDFPALRLAAHTLKGSVRYFGAQPVLEAALRLEAMGQVGNLEGADEVFSVLDCAARQLLAALTEHAFSGNTVTMVEAKEVTP